MLDSCGWFSVAKTGKIEATIHLQLKTNWFAFAGVWDNWNNGEELAVSDHDHSQQTCNALNRMPAIRIPSHSTSGAIQVQVFRH